jgi:hypothetical protein
VGPCETSPSSCFRSLSSLEGDEAEVAQELGARPSYTVRSVAIRGEYKANESASCPGGFDACERIVVRREDGTLRLEFGYWDDVYRYWRSERASAWSDHGVIVFATGEIESDCDDPGCGNMTSISGVIYPVRVGERWVPQIKATYSADFPYPESEEDYSGIVRTTMRLSKQP